MTSSPTDERQPTAWLLAIAFGVASEVWMYRQATLMKRLKLTVMTNRHDNRDRFPADEIKVRLIQGRFRLPPYEPLKDLSRTFLGRFNRQVPGLPVSATETRWWLGEIERDRPNVVLAHFGNMATDYFPLFRQASIPVVAHFNGFDLSRALRNRRYVGMLRETAGQYAAYIVVAQYMHDALRELGVPAEKIIRVPYGTPVDELGELDDSIRESKDDCRFLAVGRLVDKKRPELTLRAFAKAVATVANCQLVFVGDGPLLESCRRLASELGVEKQVEFLGAQPQERVQREFALADVFVQHSATASDGDKEGWPVAIAEAAAKGLPVVATRHASIPEQIEHGVEGLLCDEGDWQTMSQNMITLAANPAQRRAMGIAAHRKMSDMPVEKQVGLLEDVLLAAANNQVR